MADDLNSFVSEALDKVSLPDAQKAIIKNLAESMIGNMTKEDQDNIKREVEDYMEKSKDNPTGALKEVADKIIESDNKEANLFD